MVRPAIIVLLVALCALLVPSGVARSVPAPLQAESEALLTIRSRKLGRELKLDGIFYETSAGRQMLPRELTLRATNTRGARRSAKMGDGRLVTLSVQTAGANHFNLQISAEPGSDIMKWGLAIEALGDEYYTGLMERVVDGPQRVSWAPGIKEAMDLRGQKVEMVVKPTTSVYAPFYISSRGYGVFVNQGKMMEEALAKGYNLAGQERPGNGNNYPMVDLTNPQARKYWQDGISKLLKLGVAAFKLDRGEEDIPEGGPPKLFDGRSIRENRNAYVAMYVKAVYDVAKRYRGTDFVLMPRGAYTGSSAYGVFWGGDIGGTQQGPRASIIAAQRAAVMGYPNWGSDTCGYNEQLMEQEVCARWLEFSCFTPIMEVGPTRNVAFWNLPRAPEYDAQLIAIWRLYARLHQRLAGYGYKNAQVANRTGMPIIRPLWLVDPRSRQAWTNWWTYLYGPDVLVSPIWEKGKREQEVYFPNGSRWRDVWHRGKTYEGGTTATVHAELYQIPMFIREGSAIKPGDLHREYRESLAIAQRKPDLSKLDAAVKEWFERNRRSRK